MDLNIFIVLLFTLFAGGHSLQCYECPGGTGSCVGVATTCSALASNTCSSATVITAFGSTSSLSKFKNCSQSQYCGNSSVNIGVAKIGVSMQCCNTDLCNNQDVPDYSYSAFNGKQCYYCNGTSCLNTLSCSGTEDYCIKAQTNITSLPSPVKGCVSKSFCDAASQAPQGFFNISCCQGNLCNGAMGVTQNLFFLSWPFISYIMFH